MHPNPKKVIPILILLAVLASAGWYFTRGRAAEDTGPVSASGTIEATQMEVSPELGGRVAEVLVREGDAVKAGQPMVRFDTSLLKAQLEQAQASLELAQRNYNLVASGTPQEQRQAAVTAAQLEIESATQALEDLNGKAGLAEAQAEQRVAAADKALDKANDRLESLLSEADPEDIERAEAELVIANDRLKKAREDYDRYLKYQDKNVSRAIMQIKVSDAKTAYDAKVTRLNNLLGHANQIEVALAEADVKLAEAELADARRELEKVIDGPDPEALALAQDRLAAAQARLEAAGAEPTAEQLAVAQAQLDAASAAVQVIQTQMEKLLLAAPMDGIVLTRSVEPGEFASPGAPLLALARLDELNITIYLPEDSYGTVRLGQTAQVSVDSFPGQTFQAAVVQIADQAEYTPRNVQTAEGRRTTVFAVKLALENSAGQLKPGMPADVTFGE
jgi:multidrug resistance efflux pump